VSAGAVSATGAVGTVGLRGAMVLPSLVDVTRDTKPRVILGQIKSYFPYYPNSLYFILPFFLYIHKYFLKKLIYLQGY
jgi:hypothetical protein